MVSNRKARLLLDVPAVRVGVVKYFNVTNTRRLHWVGCESSIITYRNSAGQNRSRKRWARECAK